MVYLAGLLIWWISRALIPSVILLAVCTAAMFVVWGVFLRPRKLSGWQGWVAVVVVTAGFGGVRTWQVWRDFTRPEFSMFRRFVADPIPSEVEGLAPASAAPVMFHDGAYITFRAPEQVVGRIVTHSLPGSQTLTAIDRVKQRSRRSSSNRVVIAAADGRSYLKVGLEWVAAETSPESKSARVEVEKFLKNSQGSAYVLLQAGDWGYFKSLLTYEPGRSNVTILQYTEVRR